ncbi:uncharacterized protein LOC119572433 [Penaeus monodon]|uniref:uncharacterized protein LOC119572433 n=1 Tax=Penaeus monodon TaxID=6687 RepID=UPI0018A75107|nr:uncharacterized protein LOC119572433 [Penaeus monodon]
MNRHCHCSHIVYSNSLYPVCSRWRSYSLCGFLRNCSKHSTCINYQCVCDEGYYQIDSSCRKVQLQPVMGTCREAGQAVWLCDVNKHSVCINNICVCAKGYVPTSDGLCEPQELYMKNYGLSEYRVKPGEYCRESADCIEGLECERFKCRCPRNACRHDQRKDVCDCGKVESQIGPIILGIFLGLFVILFWCCTIKRTIRKHKKMMRQFSSLTANDNEYVPPSYALSPVHSSIQTETTVDGTASPASRTAGTPIPEDTGTFATYSINPPTAPNDPVNPESDKPPSYIEVISSPLYNPVTMIPNAPYPHAYIPLSSSTQRSSSPSHSLSREPHSRSSSPVPHSSPSVTTYPLNPLAAPHPGSPGSMLHPVNSSAPAGATSSSSPSHSVPEAAPAYNPYFNEDSAPGMIPLSSTFFFLYIFLHSTEKRTNFDFRFTVCKFKFPNWWKKKVAQGV